MKTTIDTKQAKKKQIEPSPTVVGKIVTASIIIAIALLTLWTAKGVDKHIKLNKLDKQEVQLKRDKVQILEKKTELQTQESKKLVEGNGTTLKQLEEQQKANDELNKQLEDTRAKLQAKLELESAKQKNVAYSDSLPATEPKAPTNLVAPSGGCADWLRAGGVPEGQLADAVWVINKESECKVSAKNPKSSAYGICQTMMSIHKPGGDFRTNPVTQAKWCHQYSIGRYGSWHNAKRFWLANEHW